MPSAAEIREQIASESYRRNRLGVPSFAGGFLYLLSAIIIYETLGGAPTVGLLQGLAPALSGVASPTVSPRTAEVKFISHHAFALIAGSTLASMSLLVLTTILLLLRDATRFRRPETWAPRYVILGGGIGLAIVSVAREVASAIETHSFAVGHDFTSHAVDQALTSGTATVVTDYLSLLAALTLAAGMIATMLGALRVGLLPRWMSFLGMFAAVLIVVPIGGFELEAVQALWMVLMGLLFLGRLGKSEPPAWAAGEARPWLSQTQLRGGGQGGASSAPAAAGATAVPAAVPPVGGSSRKRRRKRGART
jgi:hypothetical protein